ncbi:MAG: GNAT family N-acetyltransferase [Pseudomonadota bacterium]
MTRDEINRAQSLTYAGEILTTEHLVLRAPNKDDVQDIVALANNRKISSMLESMPYPYVEQDAEKFINAISKPEAGECVFAITDAVSGKLMGMCGLHLVARRHDHAHMGYWIGEEFWGKGYATQAARALVDLFFKAGSEDALLMSVLTNNPASRRVIEKCGGDFWKLDSHYSAFFEKEVEVEQYRITRESWMGTVAAA